jgi:hypothetical protein
MVTILLDDEGHAPDKLPVSNSADNILNNKYIRTHICR